MKRPKMPFDRNGPASRLDALLNILFIIACIVGTILVPAPYRWAFVSLGCVELLRLLRR